MPQSNKLTSRIWVLSTKIQTEVRGFDGNDTYRIQHENKKSTRFKTQTGYRYGLNGKGSNYIQLRVNRHQVSCVGVPHWDHYTEMPMPNLAPPFEYKRRKLWVETPSLTECVPDSDDEIESKAGSPALVSQECEDNDVAAHKDGESSDRELQPFGDGCRCELIGAYVQEFLEGFDRFMDDDENDQMTTTTTDDDEDETMSTVGSVESQDELCNSHKDDQGSTVLINATTVTHFIQKAYYVALLDVLTCSIFQSPSVHIEAPNRRQYIRMNGCYY
ncbi:hypothetical protein V1505DRAFT_422778 [Lipomyces doorenjongii]